MDQSIISQRHARRKLKKQVEEYFNEPDSDEMSTSNLDSFDFGIDTVRVPDAAQILDVSQISIVVEPTAIVWDDLKYPTIENAMSENNVEKNSEEDSDTLSWECVNDLLVILRAEGLDLPKDSRTLLKTQRQARVITEGNKSYHCIGIANTIKKMSLPSLTAIR